jgi:formylglycine-generating enzyme
LLKTNPTMTATLHTPAPTVQRSLREYTVNGHIFRMVVVEKGSFLMQGKHKITFPEDFELGQYPVTQALWEAVMGESWPHLRFQGKDRPVECVSWDDIRGKGGFLDRLNALITPEDGYRFALPSEAQWEYAARGGRYGAAFPSEYAGSNYLPEVGWYTDNSQRETQRAGRKQPNVLGLYDMSGNVWEWCEDDWHDDYNGAPTDGRAWVDSPRGSFRVGRGGGWYDYPQLCRAAFRNDFRPSSRLNYFLGFRLARSSRS